MNTSWVGTSKPGGQAKKGEFPSSQARTIHHKWSLAKWSRSASGRARGLGKPAMGGPRLDSFCQRKLPVTYRKCSTKSFCKSRSINLLRGDVGDHHSQIFAGILKTEARPSTVAGWENSLNQNCRFCRIDCETREIQE